MGDALDAIAQTGIRGMTHYPSPITHYQP